MKNSKLIWSVGALFAIALVVGSAGIISAEQSTWKAPSQPFPGQDIAPPIDTGSHFQTKSQGIGFASFRDPAILMEAGQQIKATSTNGLIFLISPLYEPITGATSLYNSGALYINSKGLVLPNVATSTPTLNATKGMITYDPLSNTVQLYNGTAWTGIGTGTGGDLKPPLTISTGSGEIGIILKLDPSKPLGNSSSSPMLVFSSQSEKPKLGLSSTSGSALSQLSNVFGIPTAKAGNLPDCSNNPTAITCGEGGGWQGWGEGGGPSAIKDPIWWMRKEGNYFGIRASTNEFSDVRNVMMLDTVGRLYVQDINLSNPQFSESKEKRFDSSGDWTTCPDGYFVSAILMNLNKGSIRCSRL